MFAAEFLLLATGPEYLDGLISESTGTDYHHLSIQLDETANWAVCPYSGGACSPPSQAQFKSLISASDEVAVIADVGPDGTGETYDLDNVSLTDGNPPPPEPVKKKCKKKKKAPPRRGRQEGQVQEEEKAAGGGVRPQRLTTGASTFPSLQRS